MTMRHPTLFPLSLALLGSPLLAEAFPGVDDPVRSRYQSAADAAVVIGIEDYLVAPDVPYASRDASAFRDFLVYTRGIAPNRVELLLNGASREKIEHTIAERAAQVGDGGVMWVYFAGHGAADPVTRERLLLGDDVRADPDTFASRGVQIETLQKMASANGSHPAILVLDACYAGVGRSAESLTGGKRFAVPAGVLLPPANVTVWTAAGAGELAGPLDEAEHGLFTYLVLGALRGWADGQLSGEPDGIVTATEAHEYVSRSLRSLGVTTQTPELVGAETELILSRGTLEADPGFESKTAVKEDGKAAAIQAKLEAIRQKEEEKQRKASERANARTERTGSEKKAQKAFDKERQRIEGEVAGEWSKLQDAAGDDALVAIQDFIDLWAGARVSAEGLTEDLNASEIATARARLADLVAERDARIAAEAAASVDLLEVAQQTQEAWSGGAAPEPALEAWTAYLTAHPSGEGAAEGRLALAALHRAAGHNAAAVHAYLDAARHDDANARDLVAKAILIAEAKVDPQAGATPEDASPDRPRPLDADSRAYVAAALAVAEWFPDTVDTAETLTVAAQILYNHARLNEAREVVTVLAGMDMAGKSAQVMMIMVLNAMLQAQDWHGAAALADDILANQDLPSTQMIENLERFSEQASFKAIEDQWLTGRDEEAGPAGDAYRDWYEAHPNSEFATVGLYNAGVMYQRAGRLQDAVEVFFSLTRVGEPSERESSRLQLARTYERLAYDEATVDDPGGPTVVDREALKRGAAAYSEFIARYAGDETDAVLADCMISAIQMYTLLGQESEAAALTARYTAIHGAPPK